MKSYLILTCILVSYLNGIQRTFAQACETTSTTIMEKVSNYKSNSVSSMNSGCTPSSCRGAKTKFGEAKSITNLRSSLIDLKSEMEDHKKIKFTPRSYNIHGIVGESDNESLKIIIDEIDIIQNEISEKLNIEIVKVGLPKNKAQQVSLLRSKISDLKKQL